MPGVFAGAMLAFALSIDDFVISNFNSGTTVTFPLYIFGAFQRGVPVEVNCIAMILFGITVLAMGFTTIQQRRAERMASIRPEQEESAAAAGEIRDLTLTGRGLALETQFSAPGITGRCGSRRALGLSRWRFEAALGSRPSRSASSFFSDPEADRFAADPVEGLGRDAGGLAASTKARRVGSSVRSRAREARVRPTMLVGPTPLPV